MIAALLSAVLLCHPARAVAAAAEVQVSVSTTAAELGVPLEALAQGPAGQTLAPDLAASTTGDFAITKIEASGPSALRLQILPLSSGRLPIVLHWTLSSGGKTRSVSSALILDVAAPTVGPKTTIDDIRGPASARSALWPWILAAMLLAAAGFYLYKRRRRAGLETASAAPVDERPADVIALEELDRLRGSPLWPDGRFKEFYAELTDVARRYLERRFEIPATRLTTGELARHLKQSELDRAVIQKLKGVCDRADLVKFAKMLPEEGWGPSDLDGIAEVVRKTAPPPPAPKAPEVPA